MNPVWRQIREIRRLTQNFLNHLPMHIRQAAVDAVVAEGEFLVVYAEQV
jgi:hypothetical protein